MTTSYVNIWDYEIKIWLGFSLLRDLQNPITWITHILLTVACSRFIHMEALVSLVDRENIESEKELIWEWV